MPMLLAGIAPAEAQTTIAAQSARNSAMGGFCVQADTAAFATISYSQHFLTKGLADKAMAAQVGVGRRGAIVAGYLHHGNLDFHRQHAAAGYRIMAGRRLNVGAELHYCHLGTSDPAYSSQQGVGGTFTATWFAGPHTTLSIAGGSYPDPDSRLAMSAQLAYRPTPLWLTLVEAEYSGHAVLRLGIEYKLFDAVFIRTGIQTHPATASFGIGVAYHRYRIDIGTSLHSELGPTPSVSLSMTP